MIRSRIFQLVSMAAALLKKPILILDGGLGTTLEDEHGVQYSSATPLWSSHVLVESPSTLLKVQEAFAQAGADVILTATYQTSLEGFLKTRINGSPIRRADAESYMRSAVIIARSAFHDRPGLVALSLGAYGATMIPSAEYSGEYGSMSEDDLRKFHLERLSTFTSPGIWAEIDLVAFETLPRLEEVRAIRELMRHVPEKPYWISCVFPTDDHLPDGSSIEEVVQAMLWGGQPPFAIGLNCTKVNKVDELVRKFENAAAQLQLQLPHLVMYPDGTAGKVYDTTLQQWKGEDQVAVPWHEQVYQIVENVQARHQWQGILVGGCCKTTPQYIAQLKNKLDQAG